MLYLIIFLFIVQFYAIYRSDNINENIPVLIDWLLSDEGQQIIEKTGYIRLNSYGQRL